MVSRIGRNFHFYLLKKHFTFAECATMPKNSGYSIKAFRTLTGPPCWSPRLMEFSFWRNDLPGRPSSSQAAKVSRKYFAVLRIDIRFSSVCLLPWESIQSNFPLPVGSETNTSFPLINAVIASFCSSFKLLKPKSVADS